MFETQKNIQLPPPNRKGLSRGRRIKYPFNTIEVGAYFFVPFCDRAKFAPYATTRGKELGRKFALRAMTLVETLGGWREPLDGEKGVPGIAVFRME